MSYVPSSVNCTLWCTIVHYCARVHICGCTHKDGRLGSSMAEFYCSFDKDLFPLTHSVESRDGLSSYCHLS